MIIEKMKTEKLLPADYNPRKDLKPGDEEYEKLKSIEEISERKEIFDAVQSRDQTPESEYVSYDEAMNNKI